MVRTKQVTKNNDARQSMTELELLLAQASSAALQDGAQAGSTCLTCVRSPDQKYCYDARAGTGACCAMSDLDSAGCNQKENPQIICSTDKLVAKSSAYEVCPHDPVQCDTEMLEVNNKMHG